MTEPAAPATPDEPAGSPDPQQQQPAQAAAEPDWKVEARKWEQRAKENSKAASRLAALEESQKTEAQKLSEARDAAERRATDAEQANLRYRVAVSKSLPADLVDRLRGETEDEMAADADLLLALVKPATPGIPSYDGGARAPARGADMNAIIRRGLRGG